MNAHLQAMESGDGSALPQTTYALIGPGGRVIGLVLWDGVTPGNWRSYPTVPAQGAQIGWTYGDGLFSH